MSKWVRELLVRLGPFLMVAGGVSLLAHFTEGNELGTKSALLVLGLALLAIGALVHTAILAAVRPVASPRDEAARRDSRIPQILARIRPPSATADEPYEVAHAVIQDRDGSSLPPEHPDAAYVTLYLERPSLHPKRLMVSADLEVEQVHEARLSSSDWIRAVPRRPSQA